MLEQVRRTARLTKLFLAVAVAWLTVTPLVLFDWIRDRAVRLLRDAPPRCKNCGCTRFYTEEIYGKPTHHVCARCGVQYT